MIVSKPCGRGGCTAPILPPPSRPHGKYQADRQYCSHRCASIENARKRGHASFVAMGQQGRAAVRSRGTHALKPHEEQLMAEGRYFEAARSIYDRAYSSGWMARHTKSKQLPERRAS